jgi:hypothetical protein
MAAFTAEGLNSDAFKLGEAHSSYSRLYILYSPDDDQIKWSKHVVFLTK